MMGMVEPLFLFYNGLYSSSVFLVTVHDPICTESGDLEAALYGSFLPIPSESLFPVIDESEYAREKLPGAIVAKQERIIINKDRERVKLKVTNTGDRPIQVWIVFYGVMLRNSFLFSCRLGLIIISSRQILRYLSIADCRMARGSIFQPELLFASNLGT
jgi:hypothetical protein